MNAIPFFSVELGIALSVLALGLAIALDKKMPMFLAMIFVGFFALFHGHAHGTEMPVMAKPVMYALGFVIGTACIHIAGVMIGLLPERLIHNSQILRYIVSGRKL